MRFHRVSDGALFSGAFGAFAINDFTDGRVLLAVVEIGIGLGLYIWATWQTRQ